MILIERYIAREILLPFTIVIIVLIGLFASFSSARLLAGTITETVGISALLKLVMLRTLIALEVLIPISLYISVIIGLGRLNKDQELTVMHSIGVNNRRIIFAVLTIAIPVGIISGILSSYVRPWAYAESYILDAQAEAELNTNRFQAGRFYGSERTGRIVYVRNKNETDKQMEYVFHYLKKQDSSEIVIAKQARQFQPTSSEQRPHIQLSDGVIYKLTHAATIDDVIQFEHMTYFIDSDTVQYYRRKATPTRLLWDSDLPYDIAELQWRISRPLSTVLLALIAVAFIRIKPRQDKTDRTYLFAALVFILYYNVSGLARSWVHKGTIGSIPGIWWLYLLMLLALAVYTIFLRKKQFLRQR